MGVWGEDLLCGHLGWGCGVKTCCVMIWGGSEDLLVVIDCVGWRVESYEVAVCNSEGALVFQLAPFL